MNTNFLNQTTLPLDGILLSFPRLLMTIVALPLFVTWAWIAETFHFFFCCMFPWNRTFLGINPSANAFTKLQTTIVYFKEKRGQCQILIGTQQNNNYVEKKKKTKISAGMKEWFNASNAITYKRTSPIFDLVRWLKRFHTTNPGY